MQSLEELAEIRNETRKTVDVREKHHAKKIVVGMATSGIAAGARDVLSAIVNEVSSQGVGDVVVAQVGDMGSAGNEPVVQVILPDAAAVTYACVKPEMVPKIVTEHVVGGKPVEEYAKA